MSAAAYARVEPGLPSEVAALVRDPFWVRFEGGEATGSTNDDCRELARDGAPEGTAVVAARQTAGRGRFGRTWESPPGGAYVSVLLRPPGGPAALQALPLVIAVGVARGLESLGAEVALKWPNDVLAAAGRQGEASGGKLAGILLEASSGAAGVEWVVAGIGVNVRRPSAGTGGAAPSGVAFLDDAGGPGASVPAAAAAVLDGVAGAYSRWRAGGAADLLDEYWRRSALAGRTVTVSAPAGGEGSSGVATGVDADGALLLERDGMTVRVSAGEVTLRPAGQEQP